MAKDLAVFWRVFSLFLAGEAGNDLGTLTQLGDASELSEGEEEKTASCYLCISAVVLKGKILKCLSVIYRSSVLGISGRSWIFFKVSLGKFEICHWSGSA